MSEFVNFSTTVIKELILIYVYFNRIADNNNNLELILFYNGSGKIIDRGLNGGLYPIAQWSTAKEGAEEIQALFNDRILNSVLE